MVKCESMLAGYLGLQSLLIAYPTILPPYIPTLLEYLLETPAKDAQQHQKRHRDFSKARTDLLKSLNEWSKHWRSILSPYSAMREHVLLVRDDDDDDGNDASMEHSDGGGEDEMLAALYGYYPAKSKSRSAKKNALRKSSSTQLRSHLRQPWARWTAIEWRRLSQHAHSPLPGGAGGFSSGGQANYFA